MVEHPDRQRRQGVVAQIPVVRNEAGRGGAGDRRDKSDVAPWPWKGHAGSEGPIYQVRTGVGGMQLDARSHMCFRLIIMPWRG